MTHCFTVGKVPQDPVVFEKQVSHEKKQTIRYFPWNTGYLMMGSLCHMLYEWNPHITGEFFIPLQISKTTMDPFFALQKSVQG